MIIKNDFDFEIDKKLYNKIKNALTNLGYEFVPSNSLSVIVVKKYDIVFLPEYADGFYVDNQYTIASFKNKNDRDEAFSILNKNDNFMNMLQLKTVDSDFGFYLKSLIAFNKIIIENNEVKINL